MTLYVLENCEPCSDVLSWLETEKHEKINVLIAEKKDKQYYCEDQLLDENIKVFPALQVNNDYILGVDSIKQYIKKGYVHSVKFCPFIQKECLEQECELFSLINKGDVREGHCSFVLNTLLNLELVKTVNRS